MSPTLDPDRNEKSTSRSNGHHDQSPLSSQADTHPGGAIALVIDRLTAAMLETAAIRRNIVAESAETAEIVDDLRVLEETLRDLGQILRKLQERPYETTPIPDA